MKKYKLYEGYGNAITIEGIQYSDHEERKFLKYEGWQWWQSEKLWKNKCTKESIKVAEKISGVSVCEYILSQRCSEEELAKLTEKVLKTIQDISVPAARLLRSGSLKEKIKSFLENDSTEEEREFLGDKYITAILDGKYDTVIKRARNQLQEIKEKGRELGADDEVIKLFIKNKLSPNEIEKRKQQLLTLNQRYSQAKFGLKDIVLTDKEVLEKIEK